jgi:hypothetical protein
MFRLGRLTFSKQVTNIIEQFVMADPQCKAPAVSTGCCTWYVLYGFAVDNLAGYKRSLSESNDTFYPARGPGKDKFAMVSKAGLD